jgi:hypothetical protein
MKAGGFSGQESEVDICDQVAAVSDSSSIAATTAGG